MKTVYTPSRALEWHCAWTAAAFAFILFTPGSTFSTSANFAAFAAIMSEASWAALIMSVALARFAALIINGHYHRTPILRALTAALGSALWMYMTILFYQPASGAISTGCGVYFVLAISDGFSAWRSGRDAMIAWTIYDEGRRA